MILYILMLHLTTVRTQWTGCDPGLAGWEHW